MQEKLRLGLAIVQEHFGDIVKEVAWAITESDNSTLAFIVRTVNAKQKMETSLVRQSLIILYQHGCLVVEFPPEPECENEPVDQKLKQYGLLYSLNFDNILNRLRFSKLLSLVRENFDDSCVLVMERLILHGRLKFSSIVHDLSQDTYTSEENTTPLVDLRYKFQQGFEQLVQSRFIVSVASLDIKRRIIQDLGKAKKSADIFKTISTTSNLSKQSTLVEKKTTVGTKRKNTQNDKGTDNKNGSNNNNNNNMEYLPVELRLMMEQKGDNGGTGVTSVNNNNNNANNIIDNDNNMNNNNNNNKLQRLASGGRGGRGSAGRGGRGRGHINNNSNSISSNGMDILSESSMFSFTNDFNNANNSSSNNNNNNSMTTNTREDALWTIGWEQVLRQERHAACVQVTTDRMGKLAGDVVKVMLDYSMNSEVGATQAKSAPMSMHEIYEKLRFKHFDHQTINLYKNHKTNINSNGNIVIKTEKGVNNNNNNMNNNGNSTIDLNTLKNLLEVLRLSSLNIILKMIGSDNMEGGPMFMVNMESIISALKRRTVYDMAVNSFGVTSGRIIELLQRTKYLEQQVISDMIILPARETRERLYKLYLNKWVNYCELSKRGDFNPSSNYYFWYLDIPHLKSTILDRIYKSITNLRLRRDNEMSKGKYLLEFVITNPEDEIKYKMLMCKLNVLDSSILNLDRTMLLLDKM